MVEAEGSGSRMAEARGCLRQRQSCAETSVRDPNEKINMYKHTRNIRYCSEREGKGRGRGEGQIVVEETQERLERQGSSRTEFRSTNSWLNSTKSSTSRAIASFSGCISKE